MSAGFFDSVALANHNHSTVPGDGGQLSNLSVSGTVSSSGQINAGAGLAITGVGSETVQPSASGQLTTAEWAGAMALLFGS